MQSEQIDKLAAAFAKAQQEIKIAYKGEENPYFKSKYADLTTVWESIRAALGANELAVMQIPEVIDGLQRLRTRLMHSSGQWIEGTYAINPVKNDPQAVGSAITYARRYSLCAMLGVVADDDDDGNKASEPKKEAWQENRAKYAEEKKKFEIAMPLTIDGDNDYYAWLGDYEGALSKCQSLDDVGMIKKANAKIINYFKAADVTTFNHIVKITGEKGNEFA